MKKLVLKNKGFSTILSLLLVGFMLIITVGVFHLVLAELKDTKGFENYQKSFYVAEGGIEMGLLYSKKFASSAFDDEIVADENTDARSILFSEYPLDKTKFSGGRDVLFSYEVMGSTNSITNMEIKPGEYDIIPLFYYDINSNVTRTLDLSFVGDSLTWNILSNDTGISGEGSFDNSTTGRQKTIASGNYSFGYSTVGGFLSTTNSNGDYNYIVIFNPTTSTRIYSLSSSSSRFASPNLLIESTGQVGSYKQNLRAEVGVSDYLNYMKYSIYSK